MCFEYIISKDDVAQDFSVEDKGRFCRTTRVQLEIIRRVRDAFTIRKVFEIHMRCAVWPLCTRH